MGTVSPAILLHTEQLESGEFFAFSERTPGCWGSGDSALEAQDDYCEALAAWWELKSRDGDGDLPPVTWTWTLGGQSGE